MKASRRLFLALAVIGVVALGDVSVVALGDVSVARHRHRFRRHHSPSRIQVDPAGVREFMLGLEPRIKSEPLEVLTDLHNHYDFSELDPKAVGALYRQVFDQLLEPGRLPDPGGVDAYLGEVYLGSAKYKHDKAVANEVEVRVLMDRLERVGKFCEAGDYPSVSPFLFDLGRIYPRQSTNGADSRRDPQDLGHHIRPDGNMDQFVLHLYHGVRHVRIWGNTESGSSDWRRNLDSHLTKAENSIRAASFNANDLTSARSYVAARYDAIRTFPPSKYYWIDHNRAGSITQGLESNLRKLETAIGRLDASLKLEHHYHNIHNNTLKVGVKTINDTLQAFEKNGGDSTVAKRYQQEMAVEALLEGDVTGARQLLPAEGEPTDAGHYLRDIKALMTGEGEVNTALGHRVLDQFDKKDGDAPRGPPEALAALLPEGPSQSWRPPSRGPALEGLPVLTELHRETSKARAAGLDQVSELKKQDPPFHILKKWRKDLHCFRTRIHHIQAVVAYRLRRPLSPLELALVQWEAMSENNAEQIADVLRNEAALLWETPPCPEEVLWTANLLGTFASCPHSFHGLAGPANLAVLLDQPRHGLELARRTVLSKTHCD